MRTMMWFSLAALVTTASFAQTPAPAPAAAPAPAPRRPVAAPAPAAVSRAGIALTVTDPGGLPIADVHVSIAGLSDRSGETNGSGQINFVGMQAGTYRALFESPKVKAFEREITVRAGQTTTLDVMLNPAPPPPPAPAPPPPQPAAANVGPVGSPQMASVPDVLGREFIGKMPRRETMLACSGTERTMMIQLNEPLPDRLYDSADASYYVIGGQGTAKIGGRDTMIDTNGFISVPRGTVHSFTRRGNRPLILLAVLSGEPCEQAK
jgi:hypothetical protein